MPSLAPGISIKEGTSLPHHENYYFPDHLLEEVDNLWPLL